MSFISGELLIQVQSTINYKKIAPACERCKYFTEQADPVLDRSWIPVCVYFVDTLGSMMVEPNAWCDRWKPRGSK
jgi:hypothetical protein